MVGIINVDITIIQQDALDENNKKMEIDSTGNTTKLLEIPDKDPYNHIQSLVISPLQGRIDEINGGNVEFNFKRAFIQKSTNPIFKLDVDFGNGQLHSIIDNRKIINQTLSYHFTTEGNKILKFSGNYQDGTTFETFAKIYIDIIEPINDIVKIRATENFTPYIPDETAYYDNYIPDNEYPEIEYKVFYSTNPPRTKIMKPIIITDGIDYGGTNERTIYKIFNEELALTDTGQQLGEMLQENGYDVIIANFPNYKVGTVEIENCIEWDDVGCIQYEVETVDVYRKGGADYIQRNAKVFKELVRKINTILSNNGSTEELVVVGPGMGGLVTRWALKEMEDAGENHNVGIWVSFDAPHQGANIPTALQFAANYNNEYSSLDKLKRKAARQMLVHHYLNESGNTINGGAPGFRNRFKNELLSLGYPTNLRKVALVNGSTTGVITNNPNDEIAYTHLWMDSFPWSNVLEGYLYFSGNSGHNKVLDFDFTGISFQSDVKKYIDPNYLVGSYDNAPGCIIDMTGDYSIDEDIENMLQIFMYNLSIGGIYIDGYVSQSVDNFTFMPTKSTLDFQGDSHLLSEPICYNLVSTGETPFDSYYAPQDNEEHVELNSANVTWLLNELASEEPTYPTTYCSEPIELTLSSSQHIEQLCPNDEETYTLTPNNLYNITWVIEGELTILSSNDQQIRVKMNDVPILDAWGVITAIFVSNSVSKTVSCITQTLNMN